MRNSRCSIEHPTLTIEHYGYWRASVRLQLRRDITHRQPQPAEEHFRTEPITLVDHDT